MKCGTCRNEIKPDCDWHQGRCPYRKPMIEIQPKDTSRGHFYVSLAKSALRMAAAVALVNLAFVAAGALFLLAEILGIVEELV